MLGKLFINLMFSLALASEVRASPWNIETGQWRNFVTYRYYATDKYFDTKGEKVAKSSDFSKNELQFLAEYGVAPKWNIGFNVFSSKQTDRNGDVVNYDLQGISRSDLFARRELYRDDDYALAAQGSFSLPSYYPNKTANSKILYEKAAAELALLMGANFDLLPNNDGFLNANWVAGKIAYRYRSGTFDDQYLLGAQLGLRINEKLAIIPEVNITQSTQLISQSLASVAGDNNYNLTNAQFSLAYNISNSTAVQIGFFQHLSGKNAGAGGGGLFSLWLAL